MEKWHKIWICSIFIFSFSILGYFFITADFTHLTVSNYIGIFFFVLLLFLVVSFPVMINNTHIVIIQPILLAVFLQYGLLVEIVVSQVTILFFLVKAGFRQWERYLLNLMMFLVTSVGAAMVFFLLGGHTNPHIDSIGNVQVLPIIAYVGVCIAINHVILFFMLNKLYKEHSSFLSKDLMWEIFINLLLTPIGVLIYVLYGHFHIQAIFYAMIPVVAFSLIFRFYTRLDHLNKRLQQINVSGNIIGRQLEEHKVIMEATNAISSLVSYDYCSIFKINEPTGKLKVIYHYGYDLTEKERMEFLGREFNLGEGLSGKVALEGKYKIIGDYHKQEHILPNEPKGITRLQSILSVPLIRNHKVIGVLTVGHRERDKYSNEDATLIEIIANQTAIAIKNAEKYQRAKRQSEIDELTGLFNYRHFEHELFSWFKEAQEKNEPLSLIIMDIDHFKKINDTYGHLAGNRVLHHLSTLLIKKMQRKGLISRYGGEEFTILLPNTTEKEAFLLAEEIRQEVESQSILIPTDLTKVQEHLEEIPIQVTVSMGLACYPKHADDSLSLIRHADRAMYIGAKRKGRNKVAVYSAV